MSNLVPLENRPSYLQTITDDLGLNNDMLGGVSTGAVPSIGLNGTRFVIRINGEETTYPELNLPVVILKGKPCIDKTWYATKFVPGQEPSAPDCYSTNGQTPDPGSTLPQHSACAGCPHNAFGSGTDAAGNPTKGKACSDSKIVAVLHDGHVYKFKIPAASLKNFGAYIKLLNSNQLPVLAVKTSIGFDAAFSYPVLTFNYKGVLDENQYAYCRQRAASDDVAEIVGNASPIQPLALPAPVAPPVAPPPPAPAPPAPEPPKTTRTREPKKEKVVTNAPSEADLAAALGL